MISIAKRLSSVAVLVLFGLSITGCDRQAQKDAKSTADAIENSADRLDARIDNVSAKVKDDLENKTRLIGEKTDATADEIGNRADAVVKAAKGE